MAGDIANNAISMSSLISNSSNRRSVGANPAMIGASRLPVGAPSTAQQNASGNDIGPVDRQPRRPRPDQPRHSVRGFNHSEPVAWAADCSTIAPAVAIELHDLVKGEGLRFRDAPVFEGIFGTQVGILAFRFVAPTWVRRKRAA